MPETPAPSAEDEVVDLCRDLIRIDSSNYGDGSGPGERLAAEYVDQVLLDHQKQIRRADDPDPLVYDALERAVLKLPAPTRSPWPFVAVVLAGVAVTVGVVLTREPAPRPMPALFGSTGA